MHHNTQTKFQSYLCFHLFSSMAGPVSGDTEAQCARDPSSKPGGWITFPFMMGLSVCFLLLLLSMFLWRRDLYILICGAATLLGMSITSFGWVLNLIVFLIAEFNIKSIAAAQISNIVNGCLSMLPLVAAILADSFFGNILVISASTFISLTVSPTTHDWFFCLFLFFLYTKI